LNIGFGRFSADSIAGIRLEDNPPMATIEQAEELKSGGAKKDDIPFH
jgi:hypothetical protein